MNEGMPWATEYASFIFLGLSVCIGYALWRIRVARRGTRSRRDLAEHLLEREIAELESSRSGVERPGRDGSGLSGPAYTPEEEALLRRAREADPPRHGGDEP